MSGYTMTQGELLYSYYGAATTTTPSASAASMIPGYPEIVIPGGYMQTLGKRSSSLCFRMGGFLTATATVPTWSFSLYTTSVTPPAFAATNLLATATSTITPTAGTNAQFWMEAHIGVRSLGTPGASSVVVTEGYVRCPALFPSPFEVTIPPTGTGNTFSSWESDLQYFLWPALTLGAATAGNTVTVQYAKLYGEN